MQEISCKGRVAAAQIHLTTPKARETNFGEKGRAEVDDTLIERNPDKTRVSDQ